LTQVATMRVRLMAEPKQCIDNRRMRHLSGDPMAFQFIHRHGPLPDCTLVLYLRLKACSKVLLRDNHWGCQFLAGASLIVNQMLQLSAET